MDTVSVHHSAGDKARAYFEYQQYDEDIRSTLLAERYQPHIDPGDTVLDFGCGAGLMLTKLNCARRIGVEPNENGRMVAEGRGIEVFESAEDVPAGVIDTAYSNSVLEHCLNPYLELRRIRQTLKPEGKLVMHTPIDDWRANRDLAKPDPNHHLFIWPPLHMRNLLVEAGYEIGSVEIVTKAWPPKMITMYRLLPAKVFHALEPACAVLMRRRQVRSIAFNPAA